MIVLQLLPVLLSLFVLDAHFLRAGNVVLEDAVIGLMAILLVRRPWAARAAEWARTLYELASARARSGEPVTRLVVILGCVALATLGSALVFRARRMREWYRIGSSR